MQRIYDLEFSGRRENQMGTVISAHILASMEVTDLVLI